MDNVREKLVELLRNGKKEHICFSRIGNPITSIFEPMVDNKMVETLADHLIANGVTVQKYCNKAKSTISETGIMCTACYSDIDWDADFCKYCGAKVLPTPPKGE